MCPGRRLHHRCPRRAPGRVAVIGYADEPGKAQALADVQAAAVTTDPAEITTALRNTA
jgi:hypothetical protein